MMMLLYWRVILLLVCLIPLKFQSGASAADECERERGQHCHKWAQCERRQEDPKPRCYCSPGYRGDGQNCHRDDQQQSDRRCPQPGNIDHGSFTASDGSYKSGTIITYRCQDQYKLQGNKQRTCQQNAQWSGTTPICEPIQNEYKGRTCQRPQNLDRGTVSSSENYRVNSRVSYKCNDGLMLVGNAERRCLATGQWSGSHPRCEKATDCEREQGKHCHRWAQCERRQEDKKPRCYCSPGYSGDGYNCHQRPQDECEKRNHHRCHIHADCVRINDDTYKCKCRDGYKGDGVTCQTKGCSNPGGVTNGKLLTNQQMYVRGNIVSYQCDYGYKMIGNAQRTCEDDGRWSGEVPRCEKPQQAPKEKQCTRPQNIQNGNTKISDESLKPGTKVSYECRKPYKLVGDSQRSCQNNGQWSGTSPTCRKQKRMETKCPRPQEIPDANIQVSDWNFKLKSVVTYKCREPYKIEGNAARTCQANGRWSGSLPKCKELQKSIERQCPQPSNIDRGSFTASDGSYKIGTIITYRCQDRYKLQGNKQRTCQQNAQWSGTNPTCEQQKRSQTKCQRPPEAPNANMQVSDWNFKPKSVVTYTCRESYKLEGNAERTCQANGRWSGSLPICKEDKKKCKRLPGSIPHGTVSANDYQYRAGTIVTYTCQREYKLQGNGQRTCQNDGTWSGNQPRCQRKRKDKCENRCHENADCIVVQGSGECQCRQPFFGDGYNCRGCNKDQIYTNCASRCPATCDEPTPVCIKVCDSNKCMCPHGKVQRSSSDKTCIDLSECKK